MEAIEYGIRAKTALGYDDAVARTVAELKSEGFGILTEIDVRATLHEKLGVDFKRYLILGACNPRLAHRALTVEEELGVLLPCNVIVYETEGGVQVTAMDPLLMANLTGNPALAEIAGEARGAMERVLAAIESS